MHSHTRFNRHLRSVDQTYFEHFKESFKFFRRSTKASMFFLCHAVCPFMFEKSGSVEISILQDEIVKKYSKFRN